MTNFAVKEVSEQNQELLRQALEEAEAEMSRKFEVIREIHCVESLPRMNFKKFDDTDVSEGKLHCYAKKKIEASLIFLYFATKNTSLRNGNKVL